MICADLNVLYLSVTSDILDDVQHFRRIFLQGLGKRVKRISYLVYAVPPRKTFPIHIAPNVVLYPVVARNKLSYVWRSVRMAEALHRQNPFHLTVCMTPVAPAAAAYWFRCKTGTRFLVHWSHDFLNGWGWRLESPTHLLYWPVIRWLARRADSMRPISEPLALSILKGGVSPSRVHLLPTLLYSDMFVPADHPDSGPNPFQSRPSDERQLLFVGRLAKQKNIPLLLQAVAALIARGRLLHLWLVGNGELEEELEQLIARKGLTQHVSMVGRLSSAELQPYYANCHAFVLPSNHEGLARVLAEASLCAAPIVCTRVGGVTDNVIPGMTVFVVPPNDVEALTSAITTVLDNPAQAEQLGRAAREFANKRYPPIEQQYDRWIEYWSQVAQA
jgi:glycosyltransferase involved in cell wall biosynthesis